MRSAGKEFRQAAEIKWRATPRDQSVIMRCLIMTRARVEWEGFGAAVTIGLAIGHAVHARGKAQTSV